MAKQLKRAPLHIIKTEKNFPLIALQFVAEGVFIYNGASKKEIQQIPDREAIFIPTESIFEVMSDIFKNKFPGFIPKKYLQ